MYYEINVARRVGASNARGTYTHLFATSERSLSSVDDLKEAYDRIVKAFPAPEFSVEVTQRSNVGVAISEDTLAVIFGRTPQATRREVKLAVRKAIAKA